MAATGFALKTEWSLLCAACSEGVSQEALRSQLRQPIDWKGLFHLADHHRVQPLLAGALSRIKESIPAGELHNLQRRNQMNLHQAFLLARELIRILDCLSGIGVEVLPYKGLALAESLYGDIALRQSGDIDLLIHAADFPRIREAVRELGYTPHSPLSPREEAAHLKSGYECAFDSSAGRNLLEVQWAIQPRFYAVDFDMERLFRRARTVSVAGRMVKTPSFEDLFLVLALHAAKHVWGRLIWHCDLARIMSLPSLNWNWVASQVLELGVVRIVRVTMLLVNQILGTAIPEALDAHLPNDPVAKQLVEDIGARLGADTAYDVESFDYFHLMLRLRERKADRMRFVSRLAFTPGPGEWEAIKLPGALFPLYRIVRLSRLGARLVRA